MGLPPETPQLRARQSAGVIRDKRQLYPCGAKKLQDCIDRPKRRRVSRCRLEQDLWREQGVVPGGTHTGLSAQPPPGYTHAAARCTSCISRSSGAESPDQWEAIIG